MLLYIERWLKAPAQLADGSLVEREQGTPQGGVISPLLANIFLHHVFDEWMRVSHPIAVFARYADDIIVHCRTESQAKFMLRAIELRLARCKLKLSPQKTKIVFVRTPHAREVTCTRVLIFSAMNFVLVCVRGGIALWVLHQRSANQPSKRWVQK